MDLRGHGRCPWTPLEPSPKHLFLEFGDEVPGARRRQSEPPLSV